MVVIVAVVAGPALAGHISGSVGHAKKVRRMLKPLEVAPRFVSPSNRFRQPHYRGPASNGPGLSVGALLLWCSVS